MKTFTSFDVAIVIRELDECLRDSRVRNIYQVDFKTLLFQLHKPSKQVFQLILVAGKRLHLTDFPIEKPKIPPSFCMALRKHLRNGWLVNIKQHEFERIVEFFFKTRAGEFKLILELFGKGNVVLVDKNNNILHALTYLRMRDRNILRGEVFHFSPPSGKNPLKIEKNELIQKIKSSGAVEIVRALTRFLSIGGFHSEEILKRARIGKTTACNALSASDLDSIFNSLEHLSSQVKLGQLEPTIVSDDKGKLVDAVPFRLKNYECFKSKPYGSFNEALDALYFTETSIASAKAKSGIDELKRETEKLERITETQEKVLHSAKADVELNKRVGDIISTHAGELQVLTDRFRTGKKNGQEWPEITSKILDERHSNIKPSVYFQSFDAKKLLVNVHLDGLLFALQLRKTIFNNASQFYQRSKKAKRRLNGAMEALNKTRDKLNAVESKVSSAQLLEKVAPARTAKEIVKQKIKKKEWFEKFRWFISSDSFLVVAGKDAVSNEVLIKKYVEPNDLVFHVNIPGSPFVAIKSRDKDVSEQTLQQSAEFAAAFSRGWREGFGSTDVYWVKPNQLSKSAPSGEYVTRGAFIVRGKRNWLRRIPLRLGIGVLIGKSTIKFIGGPIDAVEAKTKFYVTIIPGDSKGKLLVRQVLKGLAKKIPKEKRQMVVQTSIEEIRRFIPYNKGRTLEN